MDTATHSSVIVSASPAARRAGMRDSEWRAAIKFDSSYTSWVIMSDGMGVGAGLVFFSVTGGLMGWLVLFLSMIDRYLVC